METLNQQLENSSIETTNEQKEFMAPKNVAVKPLKDWGYGEAGLNQGDPLAFKTAYDG